MKFILIESRTNAVRNGVPIEGTFAEAKRAATRAQVWRTTTLRIEDDQRRILARKQWGERWENTHLAYEMGLCKTHNFEG
jgi:hypothetical protein